jgi:hypothetical protein
MIHAQLHEAAHAYDAVRSLTYDVPVFLLLHVSIQKAADELDCNLIASPIRYRIMLPDPGREKTFGSAHIYAGPLRFGTLFLWTLDIFNF